MAPSLQRREDNSVNNSIPSQIWVPIVVVAFLLAMATIWTCTKKKWWGQFRMFNWGTPTADAATAQDTTELTAEQLAGSINANAPTATTRPRRNRRPRRTPSQISTISLPAYNKEPGEQELVIFRGPEDMEDMPTAVIMPSVSEDGEDSTHSRDNSEPYMPMPHSPNDQPLLEESPSTDQSMQSLRHPENNMPRQSVETLASSEEASSLIRVNGEAPAYSDDPRGDAPAYFEAVDVTEVVPSHGGTNRQSLTQPPPSLPSSPEQAPPRRSGFRQFIHGLPNRLSMHSTSHGHPSHTRADSNLSLVSSDASHGRESSRNRPSHRASPSGSGSLLSLGPFRTISRQSNVNLNSPSLISLNNISAPLTHTVVRTEFTYPKAGPTPEQLKLISSRDTFARFGMPYGADAIAYAASTSRHDVDVPPPDFDVSDSDILVAGASPAGPSRLRAMSNAEDLTPDQEPRQRTDSSATNDIHPTPQALETPSHPVSQPENPSISEPAHDNVGDTRNPSLGVASSSSDARPVDLGTNAPPSSYKAPSASDPQELKASSAGPTAAPGLGLGAPPSKVASIYDRSASRASSVQTFATAAESMHVGIDADSDINQSDTSELATPKVAVQPVLTSTDGNIVARG